MNKPRRIRRMLLQAERTGKWTVPLMKLLRLRIPIEQSGYFNQHGVWVPGPIANMRNPLYERHAARMMARYWGVTATEPRRSKRRAKRDKLRGIFK